MALHLVEVIAMKKLLAVLAAASLLLTACGGKSQKNGGKEDSDAESSAYGAEKEESGNEKSESSRLNEKDDEKSGESPEKEDSEKNSESSESDDKSGSDTSAGSSAETGDPDEMESAKAVLVKVMDGIISADADAVLDNTNYGLLAELYGNEGSREELAEQLRQSFQLRENDEGDIPAAVDYSIGEGRYCGEELEKLKESFSESSPEDMVIEGADLSAMFDIDKMYCFEVEMKEGSKSETEEIYVIHVNGEWKVDMIIMEMISYVEKSKQLSYNSKAKTLSNAANTVICEYDSEDADMSFGECIITNRDVAKGNPDATGKIRPEDIAARMTDYYDEADKGIWALKIGGNLTVEKVYYAESADSTFLGVYPIDESVPEISGSVGDDLTRFLK